ncbi:WecB/TagA/CpsF family glycosyltransferase [Halomonas sp. M1]|uniref:WecB/TagA/CpsF family glycosyltransferase n=1 Tax=Halomonas sp. M1 TaxID=3035470 RepID=UPI002485E520|nr:WecB/TagA/CpsF family glycosyltransferase [Halomonas sp. M1]WFE72459.1 WecB/TagA/CpsF family glycosyltransferase [Halomonas sp. M1]
MKEKKYLSLVCFLKNKRSSVAYEEKSQLVTFLNPYSYLIARKNIALIDRFHTICYDGFLLVLAMKCIGKKCYRISFDMTSLAPVVFHDACENKKSIFFIGSEPGVAHEAIEKIKVEFPTLLVSGFRHGFFENSDDRDLFIKQLAEENPDIVIVGMGSPLQEKFLFDLSASGWRGLGFTCGGFLHQTASGGTQYYPKWMNYLNLRWLYRIFDEPKLIRRYLLDYPKFLLLFTYDVIISSLCDVRK